MPALLTRMSTWWLAEICAPDGGDGRVVAHVEVDHLDVAAELADELLGLGLAVGEADEHQVGARLGEAERDALAETAAGAGDDGEPAGEVERRAALGGQVAAHRSSRETGREVGVLVVLAGHRPDEGVGAGAGAGVDGPRRRDDGLPVGDDQVPRGAGLAEEVEDPVVVGQVDVQVDLGTTVVQVRRHRVPHRAVGDDGDAELQPRRRQVRAPRVAVEVALAGALGGAERDRLDVGVAERDGRVRHVGDGAETK